MPYSSESTKNELLTQLEAIEDLLNAMISELRFRGCDDNHKLIRRAQELSLWTKTKRSEQL